MGHALAYTQKLETVSCGGCGTEFAIPAALARRHNEDGAAIRCPNPTCPWPSMVRKETDAMRLRKELESATTARRWAEQNLEEERRAHAATEKQMKTLSKRIAAGVCPCCHRTFQNLARHMKTKHPEPTSE